MTSQPSPLDSGPFFHGTRAQLAAGDLLIPGFRSNYRSGLVMKHVYFTAVPSGAALAAEMALGEEVPRVYEVEPTGTFEDDPNVTDKKLPGNPTRSFRSSEPLLITAEVTGWQRLAPGELQMWRDRVKHLTDLIID